MRGPTLFRFAALFLIAAAAFPEDFRPEVALCAESAGANPTIHFVFDFKDTGILCAPPSEVVTLASPSEGIMPWVGFNQGDFVVNLQAGKSIVFGKYFYETVFAGKDERTATFFQRVGEGEKAIGLIGGSILTLENRKSRRIGETQMMKVLAPDGERSLRAHRLLNGSGRWLVRIAERIYSVGEDGELTLEGYAGWRKITTPDGRTLVLVMTKAAARGSYWAGRFEGKLYRDAQ